MSSSVSDFFATVNYPSSWFPDQELLIKVFSYTAKSSFGMGGSHSYREEDSEIFPLLMNEDVILWLWNSFPNKREVMLSKLIAISSYTKYNRVTGGYDVAASEAQRILIRKISTDCYDSLPESSDSIDINQSKIMLLSFVHDRKIDFAAKMMEANLTGNKSLSDFWYGAGMDKSTDPSFFTMAWSKIVRCQGYTDRRSSLIQSASRCEVFPESIISELIDSGHNKNRATLINVFIEKIAKSNKELTKLARLSSQETPQKVIQEDNIKYYQSVLAKFAGCEDYYIQQTMIPHLRREDLIFAAPVAAKLGLQRLLDRYMNGVEEKSQSYRY